MHNDFIDFVRNRAGEPYFYGDLLMTGQMTERLLVV